jgi:hypothetical protein
MLGKNKMEFYRHKGLPVSIQKLHKKGGPYAKAASAVLALIGNIEIKNDAALSHLKITDNGEARIPHCIKYGLTGGCRLVTVQKKGHCFLLYAGSHDDVDKWLNSNKGKLFAVDADQKIVEVEKPSMSTERPNVNIAHPKPDHIYEQLDESIYERLMSSLARKICRSLEQLSYLDVDKVVVIGKEIENLKQRKTIVDVFLLLMNADAEAALNRALLFLGDITDIEDIDPRLAIVDGEFLKKMGSNAAKYPEFLLAYAEQADYKDWMTFMHPEQEAIAFSDFKGPAKLLGVSGSGKTCIVVQRAIFLANKYPKEPILVVTLNKPLAQLINELVQQLSGTEHEINITVQPFFDVCQDLLHEFEPENKKLFDDVTWKSGEHIDEIWREYYRCYLGNTDASILRQVHDSLISRNVDAEMYIREEFDWIRSAFPLRERYNYLTMDREGRSIPMQKSYRELLLSGLAGWEQKMRMVGVTDYLNISTALFQHIDKLLPRYKCILIDESQDFGNVECRIARRLVAEDDNDLFLCGDAAQKVSTKHQKLKEAGIVVHGSRSQKLIKNYRNSREILEAANCVLELNMTAEMLGSDDFDILNPEYSSFFGSTPVLMRGNSLAEEISSAIAYVGQEMKYDHQKACIAIAGYTAREIEMFASSIGIPALVGDSGLGAGKVFFSDLEQTKGFEFDYMCILNCSSDVIPNPQVPQEEHFRDLSRLYVAMTRAKLELILSYSGSPSLFLAATEDFFCADDWSSYVTAVDGPKVQPEKLSQFIDDDLPHLPIDMTAKQFLYRHESIGLSSYLIQFLREHVDGFGLMSRAASSNISRRVKWRTMGALLKDVSTLYASEHNVSTALVAELKDLSEKYDWGYH